MLTYNAHIIYIFSVEYTYTHKLSAGSMILPLLQWNSLHYQFLQ